MELSEFTPPVRLSLTDEQISQKLGSASADEAGMLAAMEFLEAQTALRDQDNKATESWLEKMRSSEDPRAAIAIDNFNRAKQGLAPLPLDIPEPAVEPVAEAVIEVVEVSEIFETESTPEVLLNDVVESGSAEENVEAFEEMLAETVSTEFELAPEPEPELENVAEELPVVEEETTELKEKPVTGFRLVSAANWILGFGVLVPAIGAVTAHLMGMNFVTSVLAALVGILVGVKVNVLGLITAKRTHRGLAVASRATFGVFGSIVPGVFLALSGIFALAVLAFGAANLLEGRIMGVDTPFATPVLSLGAAGTLTVSGLVAIGFVLLAGLLAVFGGRISRSIKVSLASATLVGFLFVALSTTWKIDFTGLARVFDFDKFLIGAPLFALLVSIFAYGIDGESISIASWGASRKRLTWPIFIFGFLLPLLSYAHVAALLSGNPIGSKTTAQTVIDYFLATGQEIGGTVMLNLAIISVLGFLFVGLMKLIEALKTLGVNHIGYGSAIALILIFVALVTVEAFLVADPVAFNLTLTSIVLIPASAWTGAVLAETVMRRGKYHDASLTRSYGFYGSVNWLAMAIFVVSTFAGYAISQPVGFASWFGFISASTGISVSFVMSSLIAMGIACLLTLAIGYPRISRQQRETKAVEERRFDLVDVVVD
ncbi:MAG: hypothetical protein RLZZ56_725 [Actinomycetota bacterium]|jgi:hypothetical protein